MSGFEESRGTRTMEALLRWVDFYSRRVPPDQAEDRRQELISDMYEQLADAERRGLALGAVNRSIACRALRGVFADITWGRIHNKPEAEIMTGSRETNPRDRSRAGQVAAVLWAALIAVAAFGLATSISEMIDTGGQRHGLTPWPGAANVSLTVIVLVGSAGALGSAALAGALKWLRSKPTGRALF
jgi:hypothetical protein